MKQRDALQKNKSKKKRNTIAKSMITTRSSKKEQLLSPTADNNNSNDRISDLPEELLHRIFSFLPIKSTAQTTVLSKRWNHLSLWRTHPHLDFSPLSPNPPHIPRLNHQFQSPTDFIPVVLSRRQQDSNISTFRFFGNVSDTRLLDCLNRVMNHAIEKLEVDVYLDGSITIPPCLFSSKTLRVLKLNHQKKYSVPEKIGLPLVHTLSLTYAYIKHGSDLFSGERFPLLRNLLLENCRGMTVLNINCPGLEILKLGCLGLEGLDISGVGLLELQVINCFLDAYSWTKIRAARLRSIYWVNITPVEFTTEVFSDLNTGFLCFDSNTLNSASEFISALCFARFLCVTSKVLKILGDIDCAGGFPCSFSNLTTLKLHTNMTKDEITGIICLLRSSPILHTITISVNDCSDTRYESWDEEQCLESQSRTFESLEHHLKVVRIHIQYTTVLMTRHKTTLNFVEFLLRHGKVLQEITLTSNSSRWDCSIQRPNILWKMKFPRASSVVNTSVAYQM
ncbi:hypothetical protein Vadar_017404 [Vaccinium darrowii]|uniref:Uncharacterized protein n=1 Tax=Vaccinium darrowii TaxID=229202 RepID=A0ACB7Z514_9ERIC|nr:hypothetical protein Vadar_017404 [Vaccinium darrowii]